MNDQTSKDALVTGLHRTRRLSRSDVRSITIFVVIAFVLAWLAALPLWLGGGLSSPLFTVVALATMLTPTIAALVVVFAVEKPQRKAWALGLWPLRPVGRLVGYSVVGIFGSIALVLVALPIGALLGVFPADFMNFSGFEEFLMEQAGGAALPISVGTLIAIQLAILPFASFINLIPALGEELGWRGWLLPKLMPLGAIPAMLISGVIWGLWHAPLVLLGYNYADAPGWLALTAMVTMCILVGTIFGWLRLRSGTVWPAALAHAAFNGAGGSFILFAKAGQHIDTTQATILGWSGWSVPLAVVIVLFATGQFRRPSPAPSPLSRRR